MPRHVIRRAVALAIAATALAGSAPALAQGFTLWVTETPAGGTTPFNRQFEGGVRSDTFKAWAAHQPTSTPGGTRSPRRRPAP